MTVWMPIKVVKCYINENKDSYEREPEEIKKITFWFSTEEGFPSNNDMNGIISK